MGWSSTTVEMIGYAAAFLTTVSFVPQAIKALRERQMAGVSLHMYALFTAGVACWLAYGLMIGSVPMLLANVVTFVLAVIVLVMKISHG